LTEREYKKYFWKQISLPVEAAEKISKLSENFTYGKKLKKAKTIEAMAWQYNIIKDTDRAIVWRNGKFEVIENDSKKI
jgi:hypothetical protein|tara:strand:+ start:980 stop:1213 length:234 start_codon:yes stop_codon:yes gene_type:complete